MREEGFYWVCGSGRSWEPGKWENYQWRLLGRSDYFYDTDFRGLIVGPKITHVPESSEAPKETLEATPLIERIKELQATCNKLRGLRSTLIVCCVLIAKMYILCEEGTADISEIRIQFGSTLAKAFTALEETK